MNRSCELASPLRGSSVAFAPSILTKLIAIILSLAFLFFAGRIQAAQVEFDGQVFFEKDSVETTEGVLREFIREQDTLDDWEKLISYRRFSQISSSKDYVQNLAEVIRSNPMNMCQVFQKDGTYMVDFLVHAPDLSFAEWNLMTVTESTQGIEVFQYAYRLTGSDWAEHLRAERSRIGELMGNQGIRIKGDECGTDED